MTETEFRTRRVQPFLDSLEHAHDMTIQQKTIKGDADKILCIRGRFVWLELKKQSGKSRILQSYKAQSVRNAGGIAIEVKPENWELVKQALGKLNAGIYDQDLLQKVGGVSDPKRPGQAG